MKRNDLVKKWFSKADEDLLTIENNLHSDKIPTSSVCFHSQQAVEKYLKGYLTYFDVLFKPVHDLFYLLELCANIDEEFKSLSDFIEKLNEYSVKVRYPYFITPSIEEAEKSYKMALKIKEFILKKVKL